MTTRDHTGATAGSADRARRPGLTTRRATLADAALLAGMNQQRIEDEVHPNPMTLAELTARIEFDILVNNAGVDRPKKFLEADEGDIDLLVDVNLRAVFLLTRMVIPDMLHAGAGSIINNCSRIAVSTALNSAPR